MKAFTIYESGDPGHLMMGGALTVENAAEIKRKLLEVLDRSSHVRVSVSEGAEVDTSFLQILCAAHQTAVKSNKTFELNRCTDTFRRAALDVGYFRLGDRVSDSDGADGEK